MNELLEEYKKQFQKECKTFNEIELDINNLDKNSNDYDLNYNKLNKIRNDIDFYKSNLNLTIKWIETGHEPGSPYTGIDNRYEAWNKNKGLIDIDNFYGYENYLKVD